MYPVEIRDGAVFVGLEPEPERERTATDVMVDTMVAWGVKRVFGMVGHSNLGLADAIRLKRPTARLDISACAMKAPPPSPRPLTASSLANRPACLTIAGPGATNLLTGLWDAKVDRAPVLALTGQVQTQVFGPGAFQDIDLASAFEAVSRFSQTRLRVRNTPSLWRSPANPRCLSKTSRI